MCQYTTNHTETGTVCWVCILDRKSTPCHLSTISLTCITFYFSQFKKILARLTSSRCLTNMLSQCILICMVSDVQCGLKRKTVFSQLYIFHCSITKKTSDGQNVWIWQISPIIMRQILVLSSSIFPSTVNKYIFATEVILNNFELLRWVYNGHKNCLVLMFRFITYYRPVYLQFMNF